MITNLQRLGFSSAKAGRKPFSSKDRISVGNDALNQSQTVNGREKIMMNIAGYYQSIAEATDKEAADFHKEDNILQKKKKNFK